MESIRRCGNRFCHLQKGKMMLNLNEIEISNISGGENYWNTPYFDGSNREEVISSGPRVDGSGFSPTNPALLELLKKLQGGKI